ncbi:MAG: NADH:ubiquinone reductase (Na(+)-transporting) subunit B [Lewinellaceae bacterium]|nr:NADH:ubiquinone reductase (Na(+)-transporting) subunit B [Lewinellaceae bacterium]
MKDQLLKFFKKIEPDKKKSPFLHTLYDGFFTFALVPDSVTKGKGVHVRDGMDLKRTMTMVVVAMLGSFVIGTYNIGHQHFLALGQYTGLMDGWYLKLAHGVIKFLPLYVVAMVVGLGIEFWYASKKGHGIEEGFLVSGALIPLIMPPDIPLWILAFSVIFAVIIGKEAFGGTGMNILNVALLSRAFIFFAYPTFISGDEVWVSGLEKIDGVYQSVQYGWAHHMFDAIFGWFGGDKFGAGGMAVVDGFSGATPLSLAAKGGWEAVTQVYSTSDMLWGLIPGSIGETAKPFIILGGLFLIGVGIASWRIMLSMALGVAFTGILFNMWGATPSMGVPWYDHFIMGGLLFAMAYMATDPVTGASTPVGKLWYGFLIGFFGIVIRVFNPAYPEGWMLAILLMNVFAPLIDHFVVQSNINRRTKRASKATAA